MKYRVIYLERGNMNKKAPFARESKMFDRLSDAKESARQSLVTLIRDYRQPFYAYIISPSEESLYTYYMGTLNIGNNKASWHKLG